MTDQLSELAERIYQAADEACGPEWVSEEQFFREFGTRVLGETKDQEGIGRAIKEVIDAGKWPYGRT